MKQVEVYTDGACSGNPGPGGWGAVLRYRFNGKVYEKELSGGDASTTNNRMELTAFIEALRQLKVHTGGGGQALGHGGHHIGIDHSDFGDIVGVHTDELGRSAVPPPRK